MIYEKYQIVFLPIFICIVVCALITGVFFSVQDEGSANTTNDIILAESIPSYYNDRYPPSALDLIINDSNSTYLELQEPANLTINITIENLEDENCSLIYKDQNNLISNLTLERNQQISELKKGDYALNLSCIDKEFQTLYDYVVISVN